MKFGLKDNQYDFILKNIVRPLEAQGAKVYCFGSRARGDHRPFSDLDIMVENDNVDFSTQVSNIRDAITDSNFPYKVDIVLFSEFADSYKPGYLKDKKSWEDL